MGLVSLEQVKSHLNIVGQYFDSDLQLKIDLATAMVITYIERPTHTWTDGTDAATDREFALVQAAILMQLGDFNRNRGDEDEAWQQQQPDTNYLKPKVQRILYPLRPPALA